MNVGHLTQELMRRILKRKSKPVNDRRRRARRQYGCETLEDRTLLSYLPVAGNYADIHDGHADHDHDHNHHDDPHAYMNIETNGLDALLAQAGLLAYGDDSHGSHDPYSSSFTASGYKWAQSGGLGSAVTITYSYSNFLDGTIGNSTLSADQLRSAVEEALGLWATYAPLNFVQVADSGPTPDSNDTSYLAGSTPNIRIGYHAIDGAYNVLAHAYYPYSTTFGLAGDVHFDTGETWRIGAGGGRIDILEVMTHELGHSLGLNHETGGNTAIMNPFYGARFSGLGQGYLLQDDINGIRAIYGTGVGSVTPLVNNHAPVLASIGSKTLTRQTDTLDVTLSATDEEGDSLTYSATTTNVDAVVTVSGTTLTINPDANYAGTFTVTATVSDGTLTDTETFTVTVTNNVPILDTVVDQMIVHTTDTIEITLSATDGDSETITYTATGQQSDPIKTLAYQLDQAQNFRSGGSTYYNARGLNEKYFRNAASNWFYILPDGEIYQWAGSIAASPLLGTLDSTYHTTISKLFDVVAPTVVPITGAVATLSISGADLTIDPVANFAGTFDVVVTASDGASESEITFTVTVTNNAPVLAAISDQSMLRVNDTRVVTVSATDADLDTITYSAAASVPEVTVTVSGADVTIDPAPTYAGTFTVTVIATDGIATDQQTFSVTMHNATPTLLPISDASMPTGQDTLVVTLSSVDGEGDPLTYSVTGTVTDPIVETAYQLDQLYDFRAANSDYFNSRGAGEKFFQGSGGAWFYILANGNVHSWAGSIGSSPLLGTLDSSYHTTLTKLYNVAAPTIVDIDASIATFSFSGDDMTINPVTSFVGNLDLTVVVSDGAATDTQTFTVSVVNSTPVLATVTDRTMSHSTDTIMVTLSATDADSDTITYGATSTTTDAVVSISGADITINPDANYTGTFTVTATATDDLRTATQTFTVTVTNGAPVLAAIGNQTMSATEDTRDLVMSSTDADSDTVTYSVVGVVIDPVAQIAYGLDQTYNFKAASSTFTNSRGLGEKYFLSDAGNWFYILADGKVYRWGGTIAASTLIGTLDSSYHTTLTTLYDVAEPTAVPIDASVAVASFSGATLTINPNNSYLGTFTLTVTASDGITTDTETFTVTSANNAPVLAAVTNRTMTRDTDTIVVTLSATDADSDTITYSAVSSTGSAIVGVSGADVTINPDANYAGTFTVTATASDGSATHDRTFTVTVTNTAPVLGAVGNQSMPSSQDTLVITLTSTDAETDTVTYSVTGVVADPIATAAYQLDQAEDFKSAGGEYLNTRGLGEKYFKNGAGTWFYILADGKVYQWGGTIAASPLVATLDSSYHTTLSKLYDVAQPAQVPITGAIGTLGISGADLTIDPVAGFVGTLQLTVTANDGLDTDTETFDVTVDNAAPVLAAITDQTMAWSTDTIMVTLSATDADLDTITYGATSSTLSATVSVSGADVTINPDANFSGSFVVTATATDGVTTVERSFTVTVTNGAPVLAAVADQTMDTGTDTLMLTLSATDPDLDTITYSATGFEIDTIGELAYQLDQTHDFVSAGSEYLNARGLGEKYFKNAAGTWFYILADGAVYQWKGSVASSTLLGTLDSSYHTNLTMLYDVAEPATIPLSVANAVLDVTGSTFTIDPANGFLGTFQFTVTANDGLATHSQTFTLTVTGIAT